MLSSFLFSAVRLSSAHNRFSVTLLISHAVLGIAVPQPSCVTVVVLIGGVNNINASVERRMRLYLVQDKPVEKMNIGNKGLLLACLGSEMDFESTLYQVPTRIKVESHHELCTTDTEQMRHFFSTKQRV